MIYPGLVSVTFRSLSPQRLVAMAAGAKLEAIEWGGDIHVPPGDLAAARSARRLCDDTGLAISAYGSYYRAGDPQAGSFEPVLATAMELRAPSIRVWPGNTASAQADAGAFAAIADDIARICDLAAGNDVTIDLEYHSGTLTDSAAASMKLLRAVARSNLRIYWQPRHGDSAERGVSDLQLLLPYLGNLHIFHWWPDHHTRLPLADGADRWAEYLKAAMADNHPRFASLEFLREESEVQLQADAQTLRGLIQMSFQGRGSAPL